MGVPGVTRAVSDKRLAMVETLMVGPRQRLFIVRRDNVEHLVLSGPDGACLILETGIPANGRGRVMTLIKRLLPFLHSSGDHACRRRPLPRRCICAAPMPRRPRPHACRQWRTFHRPQRQRPFHRPHGADHGPDHGPVDRAIDHHHDDQLCAHRGGAVAAAHRAGPAAAPAQQRDRVAGDVPHPVRDDARH